MISQQPRRTSRNRPPRPLARRPPRLRTSRSPSRTTSWRWQPELPAAYRAAAANGQPPGPASTGGMPPGTAELVADAAWCFPLDAAGQRLGLLVIGDPEGHWPSWEARGLAAGLARRITVALDNADHHPPGRVSAAGQAPVRRPEPAGRQSAGRSSAGR
jgi:hypothetical protein